MHSRLHVLAVDYDHTLLDALTLSFPFYRQYHNGDYLSNVLLWRLVPID